MIERYYAELRGFVFSMLERAQARGKKVEELKIYWTKQAPHPARVHNLMASAKKAGIRLTGDGGSRNEANYEPAVISGLRRKNERRYPHPLAGLDAGTRERLMARKSR